MSWVPPFFTCGACGGQIGRWPVTTMLHQEVLDWRHMTVPETWQGGHHRAILGTPVSEVHLGPVVAPASSDEADGGHPGDDLVRYTPPPPEIPARPAKPGEVPSSAASIAKLATENGWKVWPWFMRGTRMSARWTPLGLVDDVVLRMRRDDHRLVASWQRPAAAPAWAAKDWPGPPYVTSFNPWKFEEAWSLTHEAVPIGSPELRRLLATPRMICEECGESYPLHHLTPEGPVCHSDWVTRSHPLEEP